MNDVVLLQLTSSVFWLLVIAGVVGVFRKEIGVLVASIANFKVAGSSFEFRDRKETLQSYILLAETLIDMLSRTERVDAITSIMTAPQIEKLAAFAFKYSEEVERDKWNEEMLRNIAYLLLRAGRYSQAVKLCDELLERRPDHLELLNLKALALITTRLDEKVSQALPILRGLLERYPEVGYVRLNFALACSLSEDHDEAIKQMDELIQSEYVKSNSNPLADALFERTRVAEPTKVEALQAKLKKRLSDAQPGA